jgi:riboflavin kinase/FMN adenylyltransferase
MDRVIALGFFDGVHIGHGQLFKRAVYRASRAGARACALTYDAHPQSLITGRPVPLLCSAGDRAELIRSLYKIPEVIVDPFSARTARTPWREYAETVLLKRLNAVHLVVGYDFTFGRLGEGTPALLSGYCRGRGGGCDVVPPKRLGGIRVSSTYIRGLVAEGDMENAARFLGRRYRLSGVVGHGQGLGRRFGFPTVNLPMPPERQPPEWGVYATVVFWGGRARPAVTNVGIRPSVEHGGAPTVESTILDFEGDLYGEHIDVDFVKFLRPERRFPSVDALAEQVRKDMEDARAVLGRTGFA